MASFSRQLIYKIYNESGTYLGLLDDVVSDFSIEKTINGGDSEFKFSLSRKFDDFDENTTIKFNNRVKVYLKDEYNLLGDKLIAYGYIVAYSPFLRGKEEGVEVTCLSAVSKLSNDFYRTGNSLDASELGIELTSQRADEMMEAIITHYRSIETNSMLSNDYTNSDSTTDNDGVITSFTHRFFNMKHLDALREASKFLPKNKSGGYWFYWRIDTDGKLWVKNISTTADHSFKIGKHIKEISGDKSIVDVVNRVYFWNEKGTSDPDYIKLTNDDSTSQTDYDIMADYLTDSKITNSTAASLLTSSKLKDGKDPKMTIKITLTGDYDLSSIKPGQTCKILNAKNNPYQVGSDAVLLIESIEYSVDSAVLSLSNGHVSFSDMIEEERQLLDKHMTWFGYITQRLTAAQLGPANRTWSTDIIFSATSGANAYRQVDWTAGTVYLPAGASGDAAKRVIVAGNTGLMSAATDYYIYLDEETFNTSAANSDSGTGIIKQGGEVLGDASKAWTTDQYKGYIATIGGQTRIIRSNTATVLTLEDRWTIADTTGAYTIKKMTFELSSNKQTISDLTKIVFSNVKANALTASQAVIVPVRDNNINIDGSTQIAQRSLSADRIIANSITSNEINTGSISIGVWSGSLDNVADGSTYFRPTANQKNGGGYAFSGLDSSGNVKIPVDSTKMSSGSAPSTGIFIDSTGIYGRYGGVNKFSMLTASGSATFSGTITASTITGTTLTTATSGQRTELTSTLVSFFNASGTEIAQLYANTGTMLIAGAQTTSDILVVAGSAASAWLEGKYVYLNPGTTGYISFLTNGTGKAVFDGTNNRFYPNTTNQFDLGATTQKWKDLYLAGIYDYQGVDQPVIYFGRVSGTTIDRDNTTFSVTNPSTGKYTISHSFNSTEYTCVATTIVGAGAGAYSAKVESVNVNDVKITIFDDTGTVQNADFNFLITKVV